MFLLRVRRHDEPCYATIVYNSARVKRYNKLILVYIIKYLIYYGCVYVFAIVNNSQFANRQKKNKSLVFTHVLSSINNIRE